jgi:hypothetical protein
MSERLRKVVDLTDEVDEERQIATGVLLSPDRVDTQGDFFGPSTIRAIAHDYMARLAAGEAGLKFMHAVVVNEKLSLVENRVLDASETIGDTEHPAGTWVVSVKAHTEKAWQAFTDGLFAGFSIGGEIVAADTMAVDAVPGSVHVPDDHPEDVPVRRINDARIDEFSAVDEPAVPTARVEVLKSAIEKDAADALADPDRCQQALVDRGHDADEAELLCEVMHTDGVSQAHSEEHEPTSKFEVNGVDVDLTPPESMVSAAEAAAEAGRQGLIPSSCGTGVGNNSRDKIRDGELSPEAVREIASYLVSHEDDVTAEGAPSSWPNGAWESCGNAQYAKWGGSGTDVSANMRWAMRRVNEIDAARDNEPTYPEVANMSTTKQDVDDWVTWDQASGDTRGQVVEIETDADESFPDAVSGEANIPQAREDEPVYLIEVWDGFGDEASQREEESGRGDTMHVVQRETAITEVSDPREREAAAAGLMQRAVRLITGGETDDASGAEDSGGDGTDTLGKVGRTLSQANVAETKAVHDAASRMLDREGHRDHEAARTYSADPNDEFELAEHHSEKLLANLDIQEPANTQDETNSAGTTGAATGDESDSSADDDATDNMTDNTDDESTDTDTGTDTDKSNDPPEWFAEEMDKVHDRIDDLEKDADTESDADEPDVDIEELQEKLDDIEAEKVDLEEKIERVAGEQATSDQLSGSDSGGDESELDKVATLLS